MPNLRPNRKGADSARILKQKLARLDPGRDCVAIFKPGKESVFYVPDAFYDEIGQGKDVPAAVWAVFAMVHIYQHRDDPTIHEFVDKVRQQVLLDLRTQGESAH